MRKILSGWFFLMIACVIAVQSARAQSPELVSAAKKEGKLVWYTSMAIDTSKPLVDVFEKQYAIKIDLVRAGEEQLLNRILTEDRAGKSLFDVVSSSGIQVLAMRNYLA